MFSIITYSVAGLALLWSLAKDRRKTKQALMKAWRSFNNMLPDFAGILALIGLLLSVLSPETISAIMGSRSGMLGMVLAALLGAITLIPGFVAFPLAASLLSRGAGVTQMAVFVSTLMMVGIVTMPLERKHFGAKATYLRNGLSFLYSFVVALVIGVVVK
ncbi:MAG: permease [Bacillota bacterium]|jgi:uncharacterized membrane protein YraQ (UPF0718 family)